MGVYVVRTGERDVTRAEIMDLIGNRMPEVRGNIGEIDFVDEIPRKDVCAFHYRFQILNYPFCIAIYGGRAYKSDSRKHRSNSDS